jgi:hypothetical protein
MGTPLSSKERQERLAALAKGSPMPTEEGYRKLGIEGTLEELHPRPLRPPEEPQEVPAECEDDIPFDLQEVTELLGQPLMLSQLELMEPKPPWGDRTDEPEDVQLTTPTGTSEKIGAQRRADGYHIEIYEIPTLGLVAVCRLSERSGRIEGFVASRLSVAAFDSAVFYSVAKFVEYAEEGWWAQKALLEEAEDEDKDDSVYSEWQYGCVDSEEDDDSDDDEDVDDVDIERQIQFDHDDVAEPSDWRSSKQFTTYLMSCRAVARDTARHGVRDSVLPFSSRRERQSFRLRAQIAPNELEANSNYAWMHFFRIAKELPGSKRFSATSIPDASGSVDGAYLDSVAEWKLGLFPWRLAAAEIMVKLNVGKVVQNLARLAARLERYPSGQSPTSEDYTHHTIAKKSGGGRQIQAPSAWLKALQRALYRAMEYLVTSHAASHGFERERSIVTNAQIHCGQPLVVRYDLKGAFQNTKQTAVMAALKRDLAKLQLSETAFAMLGHVVTLDDVLPTGAPTSPFLLNRVLFELDSAIAEIALRKNVRYSRYADDLTLSGRNALSLLPRITQLLRGMGYSLNAKKTRVYRKGGRQLVTGLVVNNATNLPRDTRRNLRAAVHAFNSTGRATWKGSELTSSQLSGHLLYYAMTNANAANGLLKTVRNRVGATGN